MSTLEKLFVQIFDRKNWIIDQLQQQRELYDQYLASTLLINGIRPPSWLWSAGLEAGSAELKELKKEELISGLLFPPPRPNIPSTVGYNTLYNRADVTANNGQSSEDLFTETCASNKYFDAEDRSTLVPKCHLNELDLGHTLNCVPELDHTITTTRDHTDAKMSDTYYEPDQSLARIQRSRSRQKALELRTSAKVKSKKRPRRESCTSASTGRTTRSRTFEHPNQITLSRSTTQKNSVDKLQSLNYVDRDDGPNTVLDTQDIIKSSKSGQKDVELCNVVEANTEKHPSKGDITDECIRRMTSSQTTQLQINSAEEFLKLDNCSNIPRGVVTRSRSAAIDISSQLEKPLNLVEGHDFLNASDTPLPTVLCNDVSDIVQQERRISGVAEIELFSNVHVEACSIRSRSNMSGAIPGVEMEFLVLKPPSDNGTFVEPKHLVFDDIEDCILNENISPVLEEEKRDGAPETQVISLGPAESLRNVTSSDDLHEDHSSFVDEQLLEKDLNIESVHRKDKRSTFYEDHEESLDFVRTEISEPDFNTTSTGKTPENLSSLPSWTGPSEMYEDEVADTSPESNKMLKQLFTELSREVTISSLYVDEQLLVKDQTMEVKDRAEEELKAFAGAYGEVKLEFFRTDRSECDLYPTSSTSKSPNLAALSSSKGRHDTYEDLVADRYAENNIISKQEPNESLKKVTISNDIHDEVVLYVELLGADNTMEVVNRDERSASKTREGERFEFVEKEKSDTYEDLVADRYAEKNIISKQEPTESLKKVTISNDTHDGIVLYVELPGAGNTMEVVNREERSDSSKTHGGERFEFGEKEKSEFSFHPALSSGKISNASSLSSRKGTSEIYEVVETELSPENNKISKQATSPSDNLTTLQVGRKSPLASQLPEVDISLPGVMDPQKDSFGEDCTRTSDVVPTKRLPQDMDACDGPKNSASLDFNDVAGFSLVKKPEISLGAQESKFSYVVVTDAAKRSILEQAVTPDAAQMHNVSREAPNFLRSHSSPYNAYCSKSNGSCFVNKSIQSEKAFNSGWEKSWPQYKRRKVEVQSSNMFTISPRLMTVKQLQRIHEENTCRSFKSVEDGLGVVLDFQHFPISCDLEVNRSNVTESPSAEMCWSEKCHKTERFESLLKVQTKEGEIDMEGGDQDADAPLGFEKTQLVTSLNFSMKKGAHGNSHGCFKDEMGMKDSTSIILNVKGQIASEDDDKNLLCLNSVLNLGSTGQISSIEGTTHERNSNLGERLFSYCSVGSPDYEDHGLIGADQTMPEFEGFSIGVPTDNILPSISGDKINFDKSDLPSTTSERIRVLEQLCRSTSLLTPLPCPSKYILNTTPDIYQSLPNGLLERMDVRNTHLFNDDDIKQLKANYNLMGVEVDHNFLGRSCSNFIFSSSCNVGNPPYTPPVGKFGQRITSISASLSSQKQPSVNPEMTCFRIDEDTSTSEENGKLNEAVDPFEEGVSPREMDTSTNREPLIDMTNIDTPAAVYAIEKLHDSGSLNAVKRELNIHGKQMVARNGYDNEIRCKDKNKENPSSSIGRNSVGKVSESLHNRFSRPQLSGKASEKKGSQSFFDKGCKRTNIVSNISSFIPLVQQKRQPAAVFTGKRDIKVKALEAAEAAKRIEEKREIDRKMKKEATKLERARLEQEKIRQLELQRKKKEEERRKKESEMAARKRQREEEDRKGKMRKRKCIEEARRQQKDEEEKLRVEKGKGLRRTTADEREGQRKELHNEERKYQRTEKGREGPDCWKKMETGTRIAVNSAVDARKASDVCEDFETFKESHDIEKVVSNSVKGNEDGSSVTKESLEQSYGISPYQCSDDEEEEEESIPKNKFIPSWAREKHLASILPSLQQIDPYEIFSPASFCCMAEVLLPQKNPK